MSTIPKKARRCKCLKTKKSEITPYYVSTGTYKAIPDQNALREEDEKNEFWRNLPVYSLPTHIGFWLDTMHMKEEKLALMKYKKDHCQTLLQKTKLMFENLLENRKLERKAEFVQFNKPYMLKAPVIPNKVLFNPDSTPTLGLYLSCILTEREVDHVQHFVDGCLVTASSERTPCVRNTFEIISCNENRAGMQVCYTDDIYITMPESNTKQRLYLRCENSTFENFGALLPVTLSDTPDGYCRFKIFHFTPQVRRESAGSFFYPGTKFIIKHTATGHNLAVNYRNWIPTFFGAECSVICHTYQDTHRMETAENIWEFVGYEEPNMNLFIRAAKGENIPEELLG